MQRERRDEEEITFAVEPDLESGTFVASWDDPAGGGITTQAGTLVELAGAIREAVLLHFSDGLAPRRAMLNYASNELPLV